MRIKGRVTLTSSVVLCLALAAPVGAHEFEARKIVVEHPWLRAPADGQSTAPLFMTIRNTGDETERLTGAASEKVGKAVVHGDPKNIVFPPAILIPPHSEITLAPGGAFVGLHDVRKMNPVGWGFEVELAFEKAGKLTIEAEIEAPDAAHAHDAEAAARWEKAHAAPKEEAAPAAAETHHHGAEAHHHHDDAAEGTPAPANPDEPKSLESLSKLLQEMGVQESPDLDVGPPDESDDGMPRDASPQARYDAERNSMDHSQQDFGVPGIPPKDQ